jgi:membrane protease YdiL (CAAX protease family)
VNKITNNPRWGIFEIIVAYLGIFIAGAIFTVRGESWFDFLITHTSISGSEVNFFIFSFAVQFLVIVIMVFILTVWLHHTNGRELGLRPGNRRDYYLYGILGGIFLLVIITLMGYVISYFQPELEPQPYEAMLRSVTGPGQFIFIFLIGAVLAPLSEELFYRGMMYPVFKNRFGPLWGAIAAGAIFGISHWDLWRTITLTIGGALLCYIYEKSGSIFVSALAHGVWNGLMSIIIYLSLFAV